MKLTLLFLSLATFSFAQTRISGTVTDESGQPIPGANIVIKDTYDGTSSAVDGTFSFTTEEKGAQVLSVTFVGYKLFEQNITPTGQPQMFNIQLKEEINQLDAVVISAGSFKIGRAHV